MKYCLKTIIFIRNTYVGIKCMDFIKCSLDGSDTGLLRNSVVKKRGDYFKL